MHAIHYAAYRGDVVALRGRLSDEVSPDDKTLSGAGVGFAHGCAGKTPLHCVCCFDTDEEIRTLGAQHIQLGGDMSIERAYAACCRDLVEAGADVNAVDVDGDSVLHYAVAKASTCDEFKVMQMLIDAGADVNVRGDMGLSLLHWTVVYDNTNALGLLLRAGAAVNTRITSGLDGYTPFDIALDNGHRRAYPLFLRAGAEIPGYYSPMPNPYLLRVQGAGGFEKYANQHLTAITALFVRTDRPRLPPEMVRHIFSYWLHAGYYLY